MHVPTPRHWVERQAGVELSALMYTNDFVI